jgi:pimeloyl-ACP methyl ester carboxylesterase
MQLTDADREDPLLSNGSKRELIVRFWYPAAVTTGCRSAPYTSPEVWSYFSELTGTSLPTVRTHSCLDALVADGAYPVVVFSHGLTGTFSDYTFLFEDLASRGYIVVSVNHTYEATAAVFADGRMAKSLYGSHLTRIVRQDESALSLAESVRVGDVRFVVDELERLNARPGSPFAAHLDTAAIATAGHSLGALTALQALETDARIRAAIVLDGVRPDATFTGTDRPVLLLDAGREEWAQDERSLWSKLHGPRLAVNLKNSEHITPTDAVWLARGVVKTGGMSPETTIAAMRNYIAAFLDAQLQGRPVEPLLKRRSPDYPDAEITLQQEIP